MNKQISLEGIVKKVHHTHLQNLNGSLYKNKGPQRFNFAVLREGGWATKQENQPISMV